jgi:uncharacterized protein YggE
MVNEMNIKLKLSEMKKCVLTLGLALLIMPLFSQKTNNVLKVKGEAILSYTPEEMEIEILIKVKDSVYENCSVLLIRTYNSVVDRLLAIGVNKSNIKTGGISLHEEEKDCENIKEYTWNTRNSYYRKI